MVRIRIQQRLAITRDAFEATLELDNGESDRLAGIKVVVKILDRATFETAEYKFAMGEPEVSGMGSVDGNGVLEMGAAGTASWLIIPYSEAAPSHDVQYDIGGTLYYTVGGQNITVPLFPETITVTPDPRLYLNYFLERNVRSDNPMTEDVIEPTIPYTLGLLITNDGYGVARNTRITSGQPEIIENEKGLLINFKIVGAQVDNQPVSPSLTVTFGDIQARSTRVSRWMMTSSLKGTFSNYTATFENVNPLGDPQLSVMESVLFHELLHVVRVDLPEDDGLFDFLVFGEHRLDLLPDRIYQNTDGRHPLNVSSCNITSIDYVSATQIQVHVSPDQSGWVYFRGAYTGDEDVTPVSAVRSDTGRSINVEYNLWIDRLEDDPYLQLIDYIDTAGASFTYDVTVTRSNTFSPRFEQTEFPVNVSEDVTAGVVILLPNASDNDPGQHVAYSIQNINTDIALPFEINATSGAVRVIGQLDRELVDSYTFNVIASDDGTPVRTSAAAVQISVLDVNDNAPVFDPVSSDTSVEETAAVGYELATITASDPDVGNNGAVGVQLVNITSLFSYNTTTRRLTTAASLAGHAGQYMLLLRALDQGSPTPRSTELTLVISVVASNRFTPEFDQPQYMYDVLEVVIVGTILRRVEAVDQDNGSVVHYNIAKGILVPFSIDETTGNVSTTAALDRETTANYTFHVLATDNGAPPTGPKTATAEVTVTVGDVNDNAPAFPSEQFSEYVEENSPIGTEVMRTKAVDVDAGDNGDIAGYSLQPPSSAFAVSVDGDFAVVRTTQVLDVESADSYELHLVAVDKGSPPMTTSVLVRVDVTDVNDNPPHFNVTDLEIWLPRVTAVNSLITTFTASDADVRDEFSRVFYSVVAASTPDIVIINRDTGALRLLSSLTSVTSDVVNVTVRASDGLHEQVARVTMHVVDQNLYAPVFSKDAYSLSLKESTAVGTTVLRVSAVDTDSSVLAFSVVSGNTGNVFSLKPLSGELVLLGSLDHETTPSYELVITVSDGGFEGDNVLSASATINVTVQNVNEFSPQFDNGAVFQVAVEEEATRDNIVTVSASDGDDDVITYSIATGDEHFAINASTGQIDLVKSLDRESVQEVRLEVWATDNGTPAKSSSAEVFVTVTNINDNAPEFGQEAYSVSLKESTVAGTTLLQVNASDADSSVLTFSIVSGNTANAFSLKPLSGELVLLGSLDHETTRSYELVIVVSDGGFDGDNVLSASATINITVQNVNEFSPQFDNGAVYNVNVTEESTRTNIVTVSASDGDDDVITYSIASADEHFAINASTGQIDLVKSLDRESVQEVRLEVWATDNGTPAKSSMAEVLVSVTDINDDNPVLAGVTSNKYDTGKKFKAVQITTSEFVSGRSVYRAEATDADSGDNGDIRYSLSTVTPSWSMNNRVSVERNTFMVDEQSGQRRP
ncbi:Protocadherin Fat 4 [Lamellibrachia satsuma]|nr:Protocadherin Fat 4 [Lamellibrachia satsuma]